MVTSDTLSCCLTYCTPLACVPTTEMNNCEPQRLGRSTSSERRYDVSIQSQSNDWFAPVLVVPVRVEPRRAAPSYGSRGSRM